jgi:hypothetical protein
VIIPRAGETKYKPTGNNAAKIQSNAKVWNDMLLVLFISSRTIEAIHGGMEA